MEIKYSHTTYSVTAGSEPQKPNPSPSPHSPLEVSSHSLDATASELSAGELPASQRVTAPEKAESADNSRPPESDKERVKQLEQLLETMNRGLSFHLDEESGKQVVSIVDKQSGEVIRQVPAQELLELNKKLAKYSPVLLSQKI